MGQENVHKNIHKQEQKEFNVFKESKLQNYNALLKSAPFWKMANTKFRKDKLFCSR